MQVASRSLDQIVTTLVPSLSRSLAEQFNVFRVMHHGTHEKQLSNVFAWLLRPEATHELGEAFQRLFVEQLNRRLPSGEQLPVSGYRVSQEVDTSGHDALEKDIADIVLTGATASIVVENFESSDGHGHDFYRYLGYGASGGRQSAVVLLCGRHEPHRQTGGWENAAVVTYAELIECLQAEVASDAAWRRTHPQQEFFIEQMAQHFTKGPGVVSDQDRIAFITAMCETGESARYGYRPQEVAAQEFVDLVAQHARRQFEEGRKILAEVKATLKGFAQRTLVNQVNEVLSNGHIHSVQARFVGQWEWCVTLQRADAQPTIYLEFGPTVVVENGRVPQPLADPDYSRIFVTRQAAGAEGLDRIIQSEVGLADVLTGLGEDTRLRDAVVAAIGAD